VVIVRALPLPEDAISSSAAASAQKSIEKRDIKRLAGVSAPVAALLFIVVGERSVTLHESNSGQKNHLPLT
jgi:hypothetical protein